MASAPSSTASGHQRGTLNPFFVTSSGTFRSIDNFGNAGWIEPQESNHPSTYIMSTLAAYGLDVAAAAAVLEKQRQQKEEEKAAQPTAAMTHTPPPVLSFPFLYCRVRLSLCVGPGMK